MTTMQTLNELLPALNDLLVRERIAITLLDLEGLSQLQEEKAGLLAAFDSLDQQAQPGLEALVAEVQANNERNQHLMQASMKLFGRLRRRLLERLSPTYGASGVNTAPSSQSRLLAGSV